MTMTTDAISGLEPLRRSAQQHNLDALAVFVPDDDDTGYADNSYIFFADYQRANWRDVLSFKFLAERLLGGQVHVMRHGAGDTPELVQANTNAIPIIVAA